MPEFLITPSQIEDVIREKHTREEWAQLFNLWKFQADQGGSLILANDSNPTTVLMSAIKPPKRARSDLLLSPVVQGKGQDMS